MAEINSIAKVPTDQIERHLYQISTTLAAIVELSMQQVCEVQDETVAAANIGISALAEKAGYLSDKCINLLGGTGSVGDIDAWVALTNKQSNDDPDEGEPG